MGYLIAIFLFLLNVPALFPEGESVKKIAVLPLVNKGDYTYDYISQISQSHLTYYLNMVSGYESIPTEVVEKYLFAAKIDLEQLEDVNILLGIGKGLGVQQLIESSYYNEGDSIIFTFKIIDMASQSVVSNYTFESSTGIALLDELDRIEIKLVEEITDVLLKLGRLVLNTDIICVVLINDAPVGTTPLDKPVPIGDHELKLVYDDKGEQIVLYSGPLRIGEEQTVRIDKEVGFPVSIQSDRTSTVYIDGVSKGTTPFTINLPKGRTYKVKVIYTNKAGEDVEVYARELTEQLEEKLELKNGLFIDGKNENFQAAITPGKKQLPVGLPLSHPLPAEFTGLKSGTYRVGVYLYDPAWLIKIKVYNKTRNIDAHDYNHINARPKWVENYKFRWYLAFAPCALQFYNHQYVKAGINTAIFTAGILTGGFSFLAAYLFYQNNYLEQIADWREQNLFQPETYETIRTSYQNLYILFFSMLGAGFGTALVSWIYSVIDGLVTMNRMKNLIHPEQKKKIRKAPKLSFSILVI